MHAEYICKHYNFEYVCVKNEKNLKKELSAFYDLSNKPKLLEIVTPTTLNNKILMGYFDFIS